jgi:baculoviral IAP repeat-containing protein 6
MRSQQQDVEMMDHDDDAHDGSQIIPEPKTLEERYIDEMKKLQFCKISITSLNKTFIYCFLLCVVAFYEMITEDEEGGTGTGIRFTVPYHYESNVRSNWSRTSASRLKRLAQESVTLSCSLPIAYGSAIFVRSDNDRLDVMKVG